MRHSPRSLLSWVALGGILAASSWASPARAAECSSDADCATGYECIKGMSSPGCNPSENGGQCPDPTPVEDAIGTCERAPVECTNDAGACPEYLSCLESQDGVCWMSSDGSTGCSEPDPNAPKYCGFQQTTCATAQDCPREFECVESTFTACPLIDCAEGTECPPCEPQTQKQCQPRQIECDDDDACPSGWSCFAVTQTTCSTDGGTEEVPPTPDGSGTGSGTGTGKGGTTEDKPLPPDEPTVDDPVAPEDTCETVEVAKYCAPQALLELGYGYGSDSDGEFVLESGAGTAGEDDNAAGAPGPKDADGPNEKADDGGCSVAPVLGGGGSLLAPLMLLAPLAARIGRRRRAG